MIRTFLFSAFMGFSSLSAFAQGVVKQTSGDWQIRCDTPPGAQAEQCALVQAVAADDRPNMGMTIIVVKTTDGKSKLLRILVPLGILLPAGLGLKIDNVDLGRAIYVRCLPSGCVSEVPMDETLVAKFSTGKSATFIVFQSPEEGIGIPVSLNGFKEGLAKLN